MEIKPEIPPEQKISSSILCNYTGASYRQIDYWCRKGYIDFEQTAKGSGNHRQFKAGVIPRVRAMVKVSYALYGSLPAELLRRVFEEFDKGCLELDGGVTLHWPTTELDTATI